MKTITARMYAEGSPLGRVTYETGEHNDLGKKMARLFLDDIVDWVRNICNTQAVSWAVTFTDGESEIAFTSTKKRNVILIDVNGEPVGQADLNTTMRADAMSEWLGKKGWY